MAEGHCRANLDIYYVSYKKNKLKIQKYIDNLNLVTDIK